MKKVRFLFEEEALSISELSFIIGRGPSGNAEGTPGADAETDDNRIGDDYDPDPNTTGND